VLHEDCPLLHRLLEDGGGGTAGAGRPQGRSDARLLDLGSLHLLLRLHPRMLLHGLLPVPADPLLPQGVVPAGV
jgi:hypothetical protein